MKQKSFRLSFQNRQFRIASIILYWSLAACVFTTFLFALIPYTLKEHLESLSPSFQKEISTWSYTFSSQAEELDTLAQETEIENLVPLLSELEPFPCMSGGYYLMNRNGTILSVSDLPTGHSQMLPRRDHPVPCTVPYLRSSDGAYILSFFYYIAPDWMLAADLSLESLSDFFAPFQKTDCFLLLVDSRSKQLMAHPDAGTDKLFLQEIKEPLLEPLLSGREIPRSAFQAKNRQGNSYYLSASEIEEWTLVYCQSKASLIREILFCRLDTIAFLGAYLIIAGILWLRIWLSIRAKRTAQAFEEKIEDKRM